MLNECIKAIKCENKRIDFVSDISRQTSVHIYSDNRQDQVSNYMILPSVCM